MDQRIQINNQFNTNKKLNTYTPEKEGHQDKNDEQDHCEDHGRD